ncbi:hypothetical protein T484DRAFT_2019335 [Baffinella frigidus]|nr:hypothetical protein T484DRAFT_2019335 [Cryptophyta sp. CCMP2293]
MPPPSPAQSAPVPPWAKIISDVKRKHQVTPGSKSGPQSTLGVMVSGCIVQGVVPGTPSADALQCKATNQAATIEPGDAILAVDGKMVTAANVVALMRGSDEAGTRCVLRILKGGTTSPSPSSAGSSAGSSTGSPTKILRPHSGPVARSPSAKTPPHAQPGRGVSMDGDAVREVEVTRVPLFRVRPVSECFMAFTALDVAARDHVPSPPAALAQLDTWLRALVKTERRFTLAAASEIDELRGVLAREMEGGGGREAALALELDAARQKCHRPTCANV